MGSGDLIDDYLTRLRAATGGRDDTDAIVDEIRDHLLSAIEALGAAGVAGREAQEIAVARFGSPDEVAHSLAREPQRAPAVPTPSTISGGTVALLGAGLWVLYAISGFAVVHLYDRVGGTDDPESSSPLQLLLLGPWALSLLGALGMLFVTGLILGERHGRFRWAGRLGVAALGLAIPFGVAGWFIVGWMTLLTLGTAMLSLELVRAGLTPRAPAFGLVAGPTLGILVWGVLRLVEVGSADQHGDFPWATMAGIAVGCAVLAASLGWIGDWLRHEEPFDAPAPGPMQAAT